MQSNDFPTVYRWHKTWLLILQQEYDHEAPVLSSLHWLPVCFRIDFKVLLLHPLPPLPPRLPGVPLSLICALDCSREWRQVCSSWRRESAAALHHNHQACFKYSALPPSTYQHIDSACAVCHVSCHHLSSYHFVFCSCVCLNHSPSSTRLLLQCSLTSKSLDPILPAIHTISFPAASMLPLQSFPSIPIWLH